MKLVYQILLGLLIFNAMLVLLGGYFPLSSSTGVDVIDTDADYARYNPSKGSLFEISATGVVVFGISMVLSGFAAWLIKSPVPIGAGMLSGAVAALYISPTAFITGLGDFELLDGIITLGGICIGILIFFIFIDAFLGRAN